MGDYLYRVTKKQVSVHQQDGSTVKVNLAEFYEKPGYRGILGDERKSEERREKMIRRLWPDGLPAGILVLEHKPEVTTLTPEGYAWLVYEWKAGALFWDYWNDRANSQRPAFYVVVRGKKLYRLEHEERNCPTVSFERGVRKIPLEGRTLWGSSSIQNAKRKSA